MINQNMMNMMLVDVIEKIVDFMESMVVIITGVGVGGGGYIIGKYESLKERRRLKHLSRFLGKSASERPIIVIPVIHPLENLKDTKDNYRYKKTIDERTKFFPGPEKVMSQEDIKAATHIISLLKPLTEKAVEPISDEEGSLDLYEKCVISIGSPLSNIQSKHIMDEIKQDQPVVEWVDEPNDLYKQRLKLKNGTEFISTNEKDYGLILKITNKKSEGDFLFLLAGIAHFATISAARYFSRYWDKKLDKRAGGGPFMCVFEVDNKNPEDMKEMQFEKLK